MPVAALSVVDRCPRQLEGPNGSTATGPTSALNRSRSENTRIESPNAADADAAIEQTITAATKHRRVIDPSWRPRVRLLATRVPPQRRREGPFRQCAWLPRGISGERTPHSE